MTVRAEQTAIAEQISRTQELDRRTHQLETALERQRAQLQGEADVIRERVSGLESLVHASEVADTDKLRHGSQ